MSFCYRGKASCICLTLGTVKTKHPADTDLSDSALNLQNEMMVVGDVRIDADLVPIRAAGLVEMQAVVRAQLLVMEAGVFVELR